ncbi:MAG TPA: methyl-accepting chemotaxis protein [Herbaspirillum sp.]|nr:methyl-accepting chemotaxis protein [Herbaspirillum sp.]
MLNNISIKTRLIFVMTLMCIQLGVGAVVGLVSLQMTNASVKTIYEDRLIAMGQLDQVVRLININQLTIASALTADPATFGARMDEVDARIAQINTIWNAYLATYLTPEEKVLVDKFTTSRGQFVAQGLKPSIEAIRAKDVKRGVELLNGPMSELFKPVQQDMNNLIQLQLDVSKGEYEAAQSRYKLMLQACIIGVTLSVLLSILIGTWLVRAITRPLNRAVEIAKAVAAGDLTQDIVAVSRDETGALTSALKEMNDNLKRIVGEVRVGTDTIATASAQIASGNLDLSSRTEEQASSLEQTAAAMEEITSTVKQNADNARQANLLAVTASGIATDGGTAVNQVVATMTSINESSRRIVDIISVIDGIAFQTNILALNAAVEAARAGEQGRGFAVVASEVRSLAQRSAAAAKEIKELIGDSVDKVGAGSKLVEQAGNTMSEIVASVKRVTDVVAEISAAGQEQSAGIDQVNLAITQMDEVTQQNAALVEEAAAAAASLQDQAASLAQLVSVFKLGDATHSSVPLLKSISNRPHVAAIAKVAKAAIKPSTPSTSSTSTAVSRGRLAAVPTARAAAPKTDNPDDWETF